MTTITTILLVEDDRLVLHTLTKGLGDAGFLVMAADSGEMAMQLCSSQRPDIALLDMHLDGISGIDVAKWLKTMDIPYMFLSAYGDQEIVGAAADIGALGYLVKPLGVQQILPAIRTALKRAEEIQKLQQAELDLSTALKTSRSISMAIGFLMQHFDTSADETFEAFRAYCRSNRKRMVDVAEQIVELNQEVDLTHFLEKH